MSQVKTAILLAGIVAVFMCVGYLIGGAVGMGIAFLFAAATNAFAFWNSDTLALKAHGAQPVSHMSNPDLHARVERLAAAAGMPTPAIYVIDQRQPNAFATGRNPDNAAVAVTLGLLHTLPHDELDAVIAHELAHIRNRDTLIMTVAATVAGAVSMIANFAFLFGGNRGRGQHGVVGLLISVFLAPLAAGLIQMSISRTREYAADRGAADITNKPVELANALRRISSVSGRVKMPSAETHQNTAHMFIINPLVGMRLDRLFATHPPAELRIEALMKMAEQGVYDTPAKVRLARRSTVPAMPRRRRRRS